MTNSKSLGLIVIVVLLFFANAMPVAFAQVELQAARASSKMSPEECKQNVDYWISQFQLIERLKRKSDQEMAGAPEVFREMRAEITYPISSSEVINASKTMTICEVSQYILKKCAKCYVHPLKPVKILPKT